MADVVLHNVTKRFGTTVALDNVSLTVPDGAFVVLLGPTGAGKTTPLRMIAGLIEPSAAADMTTPETSLARPEPTTVMVGTAAFRGA